MIKNTFFIISVVLNILFLGMIILYHFTYLLDYTVLDMAFNKSAPRVCSMLNYEGTMCEIMMETKEKE